MGNDDANLRIELNYATRELHALKGGQLDAFAMAALSGLCAAAPGDSAHRLAERAYQIGEAMALEKRHRAGLPL